jgi:site-specific recombinase XerD
MKHPPLPPVLSNLVEEFRRHLVDCAGLSPATCRYQIYYVRQFLREHRKKLPDDRHLERLTPGDLMTFVTRKAERYRPVSLQVITATLRSFFRFLSLTGRSSTALVGAVPTVATEGRRGLPRHLTTGQLQRFLGGFSRDTAAGIRDYAVALCLARLGMRAREVARLTLDDIDWRSGVVSLRTTKDRGPRQLPLTSEVGSALSRYLRRARPTSAHREVFLSLRTDAPLSSLGISQLIVKALRRTGITCLRPGAHLLRHTFATHLVQRGTNLKALADLLGHRRLDTTVLYTKVNLPMLAEVAQRWPEVAP